jgi:hypothetical protein
VIEEITAKNQPELSTKKHSLFQATQFFRGCSRKLRVSAMNQCR